MIVGTRKYVGYHKIGCLSNHVRVLSWLTYNGFKVGARIVADISNIEYESFKTVDKNSRDNIVYGESEGTVKMQIGLKYDLSMHELLKLGDDIRFNFTLKNCKLDKRILYRDEQDRVTLEFVEIGSGSIPNVDITDDSEEGVVRKEWVFLRSLSDNRPQIPEGSPSIAKKPHGYGVSINIE